MYAVVHTLQPMRWKECAEAGVRIVPCSQSCSGDPESVKWGAQEVDSKCVAGGETAVLLLDDTKFNAPEMQDHCCPRPCYRSSSTSHARCPSISSWS